MAPFKLRMAPDSVMGWSQFPILANPIRKSVEFKLVFKGLFSKPVHRFCSDELDHFWHR